MEYADPNERLHTQGPSRARRAWCGLVAGLACALLAGCGGGSGGSSSGGGDVPPAGGFHESSFEENATAELNLTHTVVVRLEACGTHPGDTHTKEGVDEIPYFFAEPIDLIVSVAEEEFDEPVTLVLLDGLGVEIARVEPGEDGELVTVFGPYTVRLEHPNAGDCAAEPIVLFLRPGEPAVREPGAQASGGGAGTTEVANLDAGTDCVGCDLSGIKWNDCVDRFVSPEIEIDGLDLTGASFKTAALTCVQLTNATMELTMFDDASIVDSRFSGGKMTGASFRNALVSATFFVGVKANQVDFSGAKFDFDNDEGPGCLSLPDLRGASFVDAGFFALPLNGSNFAGSDLRGAVFSDTPMQCSCFEDNCEDPDMCFGFRADPTKPCGAVGAGVDFGCSVGQCATFGDSTSGVTFDRVDMSGYNFSSATMTNAVFKGTDLASADLRNADLRFATFEDNLGTCMFEPDTTCTSDRDCIFDGFDAGPCQENPFNTLGSANLSGADLTGAVLSGVGMCSAHFEGATLTQATLTGAFLDGAFLGDAVLEQADLSGATMDAADLTGATLTQATLTGAFLGRATLVDAHLEQADLSEATLDGADLTGADLRQATMTDASLVGAMLGKADLREANLEEANLTNAQLRGANLNFSSLKNATLVGAMLGVESGPGSGGDTAATLGGAYMVGVDLSSADLRSVDLSNAHLYQATGGTAPKLVGAMLDSADLTGAICAGADFTQASLTDAGFDEAVLIGAIFNGANLGNAKFNSAYLQGADFSAAAVVAGMSIRNAAVSVSSDDAMSSANTCGLTGPDAWTFTEQDDSPNTFLFDATQLGPLRGSDTVTCPDGAPGPCGLTLASLCPVNTGPFPPIPDPACTWNEKLCYENCMANFDCCSACTQCFSGDCSLCSASCG